MKDLKINNVDSQYLLPKLKQLAKLMYRGNPYAYYNETHDRYIFGSKDDFGNIMYRNSVTKAVAIYLAINKIPEDGKKVCNTNASRDRSQKDEVSDENKQKRSRRRRLRS